MRFQRKIDPSGFFSFQVGQIVEAGPHTRDEPNYIQPGRYLRLRLSPTEIFTSHVAKPSVALRGRSAIVTSGRVLGGGSSVNCMIFIINALTEGMTRIKLFFTQGRSPRITTIGKMYMEIKDGVLSI